MFQYSEVPSFAFNPEASDGLLDPVDPWLARSSSLPRNCEDEAGDMDF